MRSSTRLHNVLMLILAVVVLWSLLGVSVQSVGERTELSIFIKPQPSAQLLYY